MPRFVIFSAVVMACLLVFLAAPFATAQPPAAADDAAGTSQRILAPGVLTVIEPEVLAGETASDPVPLIEVTKGQPELEWTPQFSAKSSTLYWKAQKIHLRRPVWCLEFAFKPLRMVTVDVPQANGKMARKKIWYMVYRLRYTGNELHPKEGTKYAASGTFSMEKQDLSHRWFFPRFVLEAPTVGKAYLDRLVPSAMKTIQDREVEGRKLLNTVEITERQVQLSTPGNDKSVWGVVTWEDIDPRVDHVSIYIEGLSNAYRFANDATFKPGDPPGKGRRFVTKTLRLNFYRPGDSVLEHEEEIRFGIPAYKESVKQEEVLKKYGVNERLDYYWLYR